MNDDSMGHDIHNLPPVEKDYSRYRPVPPINPEGLETGHQSNLSKATERQRHRSAPLGAGPGIEGLGMQSTCTSTRTTSRQHRHTKRSARTAHAQTRSHVHMHFNTTIWAARLPRLRTSASSCAAAAFKVSASLRTSASVGSP